MSARCVRIRILWPAFAAIDRLNVRSRNSKSSPSEVHFPSGRQVLRTGSWGTGADIGRGVTRTDLGDPYLAWLVNCLQTRKSPAFSLEASDPGKSRQPDLASIELHEIYEIKPNTPEQIKTGRSQLLEFKNLLQHGDREYLAFNKGILAESIRV